MRSATRTARKGKHQCFFFLLLFLLVFTAAGCWEGREINERAFVFAVAFDLPEREEGEGEKREGGTESIEEGGAGEDLSKFTMSIQVPDPSLMAGSREQGQGGGDGKPIIVLGTTARTVLSGLQQLQRELDRTLFLGHTRMILIGEEVAREYGIERILDYFIRDFQIQRVARVAVVEGKAREILEQMPPIGQEPTTFLLNLLSGTGRTSQVYVSDLGKYMVERASIGLEPVLPRVRKTDNAVLTGGAAAIRHDRLAGWLTPFETRGLNILRNEFVGSDYEVECPFHPGSKINVAVVKTNAQHRLVREGKTLTLKILVRGVFETTEFTGEHGPEEELSAKLTQRVAAVILNETTSALNKARELKADVIGIGKKIRAEQNKAWQEMDWEEEFPAFPVEIEVKMAWAQTIRRLE
ncbi:MAG: Ger(x)C family spore germination protein [Clostridia bacterium]|nr:Ger(x)C family spore germination protein [Clostridia bacterium]